MHGGPQDDQIYGDDDNITDGGNDTDGDGDGDDFLRGDADDKGVGCERFHAQPNHSGRPVSPEGATRTTEQVEWEDFQRRLAAEVLREPRLVRHEGPALQQRCVTSGDALVPASQTEPLQRPGPWCPDHYA